MNFLKHKQYVEDGDTVMVYLSVQNIYSINICKGNVFQTKYGALKHDDIIGSRYGTRVSCTRGWVYILFPTPELWTLTLPHRTQILYTADISLVTMQLDLKPGSVVYEAGTGSGSLSHALARTIAPNGHLYTFDFHEKRVAIAQEEFKSHGLSDIVTVQQRDVCADGFGVSGGADAVFLDLPRPWEVMESAHQVLQPNGGRLCSFSPCIEQVIKTCHALTKIGFSDLTTMECVLRPYDVKKVNMPLLDLAFQDTTKSENSFSNQSITENKELEEESSPKKSKVMFTRNQRRDTTTAATFWSALPALQITGHTGYLTFATLYPGS